MTAYKDIIITAILTSCAYLVSGLVSMWIISKTVNFYGMQALGIVAMIRWFLPSGALGVFDFGMADSVTFFIARARGNGDWSKASKSLSLIAVMSLILGIILGLLILVTRNYIIFFLKIDSDIKNEFLIILVALGYSLIFLFPAMLLDGIFRGIEKFTVLRISEIIVSCCHLLLVSAIIHKSMPFVALGFVQIFIIIVRPLILGIYYFLYLRKSTPLELSFWDKGIVVEVYSRSLLLFKSRVFSTGRTQFPSMLAGFLYGPSAVAFFEIVSRIPQFAKVVIGFINASLLPISARLDASDESEKFKRLIYWGLLLPYTITLPVFCSLAYLSPQIIKSWIGDSYIQNSEWLALMMVIPISAALTGFSSTLLGARMSYLEVSTKLTVVQFYVQMALSLILAGWMNEKGFLLAQAIVVILSIPFQLAQIISVSEITTKSLNRSLIVNLTIELILCVTFYNIIKIDNKFSTIFVFVLWCLLAWLSSYWFVFDNKDRKNITRMICGAASETLLFLSKKKLNLM